MSTFETHKLCPRCGGFLGRVPYYYFKCTCYGSNDLDQRKLFEKYLQQQYAGKEPEPPTPEPTMDFDKFADLVAAKVVALLGKKKRRASR